MAENLIYGKTVFDFGAVGDGKADDTEAFIKAFDSDETLICVPYGKFIIKKELRVKSGVKVICHPNAKIEFCGIFALDASSINISGGVWKNEDTCSYAFDFQGCSSCVIENVKIETTANCGISLGDSENIDIENIFVSSKGKSSGIAFTKKVTDIRVNNIKCKECYSVISFTAGAVCEKLDISSLSAEKCSNLIISNMSRFCACRFYGADFALDTSGSAISLEKSDISGTVFKNFSGFDGYIKVEDCTVHSLEIINFKRIPEMETSLILPTLSIKGCPSYNAICDGIPLDAVILSKKSIPDIKMTAAKLASPYPTLFSYTFEVSLDKKDNLIIPTGSFESLTLFGN